MYTVKKLRKRCVYQNIVCKINKQYFYVSWASLKGGWGCGRVASLLWPTCCGRPPRPSRTTCKLENVPNAPIALLAQRQLKFKPRSKYDFFHWNLRRGPEKWRERAFLFYFIFLKMERLAVKPILMRMGCCVFWIKNGVCSPCARMDNEM